MEVPGTIDDIFLTPNMNDRRPKKQLKNKQHQSGVISHSRNQSKALTKADRILHKPETWKDVNPIRNSSV